MSSDGIRLKRIYEDPSPDDGLRILVERLWPRGLSKERAQVDAWSKETAPSHELRRWFDHVPERWDEFRVRYRQELESVPEAFAVLHDQVMNGPVTFVYASKEERWNAAVALREILIEGGPGR